MKRKYTRIGENPVAYECCKKNCKWQGLHSEKYNVLTNPEYGERTEVCPECGNDIFYGLLELPKIKSK